MPHHVDVSWLAEEALTIDNHETPHRPLLVGGSGLVGCNMLTLLVNAPTCEKVRVLDLRAPDASLLQDLGVAKGKVEFVQHRLGTDSVDSLANALKGIDCVFTMITPDVQRGTADDFYSTNVVGVRTLLKACSAAGVSRFVYLSSIAVANHMVQSVEQSEQEPLPAYETYKSAYDTTKRRGEELVLAANCEGALRTCAVRPSGIMMSPRDFVFRNFFYTPGIMSIPAGLAKQDFADVRDVCRGMLLAAQGLHGDCAHDEEPVAGEAFWLTKGTATRASDIAVILAKHLGWPSITVPVYVLNVVFFLIWLKYLAKKVVGCKVPGFPPHVFMKVATIEQTFDNSKAKRVLGYTPKVRLEDSVMRVAALYHRDCAQAALLLHPQTLTYFVVCLPFLPLVFGSLLWMWELVSTTMGA